ncbi:MAG: STAS domain-containing protein [Janthinobacterium lividum]
MGIFGFFGKKKKLKTNDADSAPAITVPSRQALPSSDDSAHVERNAARATATAKKIDAIESEMSSEFVPSSARKSGPANRARPALQSVTAPPHPAAAGQPGKMVDSGQIFEATLPGIGMSTDFLLGAEGRSIPMEILSSHAAQVIEEAAILFADQQTDVVEQMLRSAIEEDAQDNVREVWWLLFDLLQITGKQQQFETLSLEYAGKFETSPPSWVAPPAGAPAAGSVRSALPSVPFAGKLDGNIMKAIARAQKISESSPVLRLEFGRVTEVDPVGCGLLLRLLKKLQASDHELVLAGAPELAARIRAIIETGRRDETEAPWLLLLELTRALNREQDFEEIAIDYCITFEVSPPTFVPPKASVTATRDEGGGTEAATERSDHFSLPAVIEGRTDQLFAALGLFIEANNPAIIDGAALKRIDFSSASQLLSFLAPLAASGKAVRFEQVNHLVAALFTVIGIDDVARVTTHKV